MCETINSTSHKKFVLKQKTFMTHFVTITAFASQQSTILIFNCLSQTLGNINKQSKINTINCCQVTAVYIKFFD